MNVYKVTTALKEIDDHNYAHYVVLAKDMDEAIKKVLTKCTSDEKLDEVEFIIRIDIK